MELIKATGGGVLKVSATTFGQEFNGPLIHQVIGAFLARESTSSQKTRAEVRGGGAKPWRQKGSGRARAGTSSSPIWVGGGRAFACKPRDRAQKVNRKMYRGAMRSILSELVRQQRLVVLDDADVALQAPKTKGLVTKLAGYGVQEALIVVGEWNLNLYLAARNVPRVEVRDVARLEPVVLLKYPKVLVTEAAVREIEGVLQ